MCSNTSRYLHFKLSLKSLLLAFSATLFLTACGIKGPLYQTPPEPVSSDATAAENSSESKELNEEKNTEQSWNELEGLVAPSDMPKSLEAGQTKEKPVYESETGPSTVQELEPQ
ncbi:LPS translocon maturation chaperone LptM [Colwellia echini]|uniref:Lipoprotein n=1 Tax=Colwellia echini TaxID=1982103 RepID=A0ABY3MUY8_9GAMM|nr:lipoprotein [Colwellia echini]TYK65010.1 lipoprotein [Colwellia echini]